MAETISARVATVDATAGDRAPDPRPELLTTPMSTGQRIGVAAALLVMAADGFDILASSFAAPGVSAEWKINHAVLGFILSMNVFGLGVGALLISPVADRIGRRPTVLMCLLLVATFMLLSGFTGTPNQLAACRFVTGLGIGGMTASTLSLAVEYANTRNRPFSAAIIAIGLPLGGLTGGVIASRLLVGHSWRAVFVTGAALTLTIALLATALLPESIDFIIGRGDQRRLDELNRVLRRFGRQALATFPTQADDKVGSPSPRNARRGYVIFGRELRVTTMTMVVVNFANSMTIFYFQAWLPQMIADMKFTGAAAAGVTIYQNLLGLIGALMVGILARRVSIVVLAIVMMTGTIGAMILFSVLPADMAVLKMGGALEGFMALGSSATVYGVMARAFPAAGRATGVGLGYTFGRLGGLTGAAVPGLLFTAGWSLLPVAAAMSLGSLAAIVSLILWNRTGTSTPVHQDANGLPAAAGQLSRG